MSFWVFFSVVVRGISLGTVIALVVPVMVFSQELQEPFRSPEIGNDMPSSAVSALGEARDFVWNALKKDTVVPTTTDPYEAVLTRPLIQLFEAVPILFSGIIAIEGRDTLYLGIDPDYYEEHGAKDLRRNLERRFPSVPIHIEPTEGIVPASGSTGVVPLAVPASHVEHSNASDDLIFIESTQFHIEDNTHTMHQGGAITVSEAATVGSVSVAVDIAHTYISDLRVELVSPTGVSAILFDGPSGPDDNSDDLVMSWEFPHTFRGLPAAGTWRLLVGDYVVNDDGMLRSWRLTITPTDERIQAPEVPGQDPDAPPSALFFDGFEYGLDNWITIANDRDVGWRVTVLDEGDRIPGSARHNKVAQADECDDVCSLVLAYPLDLSTQNRATLSFDRWVDDALDRDEYLKVEVGNENGYREIAFWSDSNGGNDNRWHRETYRLTSEDLASSFVIIRFTSRNGSIFEEVAIDNVTISLDGAPSTIVGPDDGIGDGPPYEKCSDVPERSSPMGGDIIFTRPIDGVPSDIGCGTLTLAGVQTNDGKEGVVVSAHVIDFNHRDTNAYVGHIFDPNVDGLIRRPIGKVEEMPFIWNERALGWASSWRHPVILADAAFVEYPQIDTCTLSWFSDNESHCFQHAYRYQAESMSIRGNDGEVYTVIGSRVPRPGLSVMISGAISGVEGPAEVVHQMLKIDSDNTHQYVYTVSDNLILRPGDSGAPVFTVPDRYNEVDILGVIIGSVTYDGETYRVFSSWETVTEALRLQSL